YLGFDAVVNGETIPRDAAGFVPGLPLADQPLASLAGDSLSMTFGPDLASAMVGVANLDVQAAVALLVQAGVEVSGGLLSAYLADSALAVGQSGIRVVNVGGPLDGIV